MNSLKGGRPLDGESLSQKLCCVTRKAYGASVGLCRASLVDTKVDTKVALEGSR